MIGLLTCESCGRKVSAEAAKSAGGKPVCPPCYEKAKQLVEEKRRKAAEEKKLTAIRQKEDAAASKAKIKTPARLAERGIEMAEIVGEQPVILPPSDVIPAAKKADRKKDRGEPENEVGAMLGSAGTVCLLARIAAVVLMASAILGVAASILARLGATAQDGALGWVFFIAADVVGLAIITLPALLLWTLGGWVKKFSALYAKQIGG